MTSILFLVETIEWKQVRSIYLENKTFFLIFFSSFFKYTLNFEHFPKKLTRIAYVFPKLPPPKDVLI